MRRLRIQSHVLTPWWTCREVQALYPSKSAERLKRCFEINLVSWLPQYHELSVVRWTFSQEDVSVAMVVA